MSLQGVMESESDDVSGLGHVVEMDDDGRVFVLNTGCSETFRQALLHHDVYNTTSCSTTSTTNSSSSSSRREQDMLSDNQLHQGTSRFLNKLKCTENVR